MLAGENLTSLGVSEDGEILDDWEKIGKICKAGRAQDFYSVGNWKNVDYGSTYGTKKMVIFRFNYDDLADGTGKANTSWVCRGYLDGYKVIQSDSTGALTRMNCRSTLNDSIYNSIESTVKDNIKLVHKRTAEVQTEVIENNGASNTCNCQTVINETDDYLWLLDKSDVFPVNPPYVYYSNSSNIPYLEPSNALFTYDFVKDMMYKDVNNETIYPMLRSAWIGTRGGTGYFEMHLCVLWPIENGTANNPYGIRVAPEYLYNSRKGVGVSPCFCI